MRIALDNASKKLSRALLMHGQSQIQQTVYYKQQCTYKDKGVPVRQYRL